MAKKTTAQARKVTKGKASGMRDLAPRAAKSRMVSGGRRRYVTGT